ncbi:F-box/kelch-repeat protein At3g23880-like [Argentina anserina]|uniref:F-box/kelch-repeat protein At3g23880-like n=1 Tax=Argentina anserina TaxID=57926 RepID=UPI0021768E2D|nr:F-box/kelch-repeat protein At3g23880-like [Potentilla anserina]
MKSKRLDSGLRRSQLPDEILQDIFLRLPLKSLVNLIAVCKSWNSLIKTSAFIQAHRNRNQHQNLLLTKVASVKEPGKNVSHDRHLFYLHRDEPPFPVYRCYKQLTHPFESYNRLHATSAKDRLEITAYDEIQTCNGLVFLASGLRFYSTTLLWNPCIRKSVTLPRLIDKRPSEVDRISYGFGYDLCPDDYKVLRIVMYKRNKPNTERKTSYEIWSLKRPSWRGLSVLPPVDDSDPRWRSPIFVRRAVHWVHHREGSRNRPIVSFDMSNEVFGEIMLPEVMRNKRRPMVISRYGNCLEILQWDDLGPLNSVDMWLMMEYGVVESWTKLVTVKLVPTSFERLGFRNNGDVVIRIRSRNNPNGVTEIKEYEQKLLSPVSVDMVDFSLGGFWEYLLVKPFEETLVLLDHPSAISSSL